MVTAAHYCYTKHMHKTTSGFTIVELLLVVVVIAILAALSTAAFSGIRQRSRDSLRKQDLQSLAKAISLYNIDNGNYISTGSGCGYSNNGEGWVSEPSYTRSIIDCLQDNGYIQKNIIDPSGCSTNTAACGTPTPAYMKVNCTSGGTAYTYVLARMESTSMAQPADLNTTNCTYAGWWATYGMNYAVRVN